MTRRSAGNMTQVHKICQHFFMLVQSRSGGVQVLGQRQQDQYVLDTRAVIVNEVKDI